MEQQIEAGHEITQAKRRIGELSAALETLEGENLKRVPDMGRATKRAALAAAGLSKTEAHWCEQLAPLVGKSANPITFVSVID